MRALWMASGSGRSPTGSPRCPRSASTHYPRRYRQTDRTHTPSSPPAPARSRFGTAAGVKPKSLRPTCRPGFRSFDRTHFERCARRFSFAASESPRWRRRRVHRIGTQLALQRKRSTPATGRYPLKVSFSVSSTATLAGQRGKSHGHSPQLVIRQTLRPCVTHPKIIPRQRPSHAKHAAKSAGQANP
jgi:hypothetical protein